MGVLLADQPFDRGPGTAFALARDPLYVTRIADILGAERDKVFIRADFDVVILALPAAARTPARGAGLGLPAISTAGSTLTTGCHGFVLLSIFLAGNALPSMPGK